MKNRTYICEKCGELKRYAYDGYFDAIHYINYDKKYIHCGLIMKISSDEQAYVATHLKKMEKRLNWFKKGAYALKGSSKKRQKWKAAIVSNMQVLIM